jgi:hypothetical protein
MRSVRVPIVSSPTRKLPKSESVLTNRSASRDFPPPEPSIVANKPKRSLVAKCPRFPRTPGRSRPLIPCSLGPLVPQSLSPRLCQAPAPKNNPPTSSKCFFSSLLSLVSFFPKFADYFSQFAILVDVCKFDPIISDQSSRLGMSRLSGRSAALRPTVSI